jgi:hypothetical protein
VWCTGDGRAVGTTLIVVRLWILRRGPVRTAAPCNYGASGVQSSDSESARPSHKMDMSGRSLDRVPWNVNASLCVDWCRWRTGYQVPASVELSGSRTAVSFPTWSSYGRGNLLSLRVQPRSSLSGACFAVFHVRGTDVLVHRQCARLSPVHFEVAFSGGKRHHRTPAGQ